MEDNDKADARGSGQKATPRLDAAVGQATSLAVTLNYQAEFAIRYCTIIFYGRKLSNDRCEVKSAGTGTLISTGRKKLIVTNDHVLAGYEGLASTTDGIHFQVGRAAFDPHERLIDRNALSDLCTFDAEGLDINDRLEIDPVPTLGFYDAQGWPPEPPEVGDVVLWAGFPSSLKHIDKNTRFNVPLTFIGATVTRVGGRFIVSNLNPDRKNLVVHYGDGLDSQSEALKELGGMSGGPAFVDRKWSVRPDLIAVISEYDPVVNQMRMSRLDAALCFSIA